MRRLIPVVMLLLIAGWGGSRAEALTTVRAEVDRNALAPDETLELTVTINGEQGSVDTSAIRDFTVTSRGTTRRINMVNGQFSQETVFAYTLSPLKTGALTIPPLRVLSDGNVYTTQSIQVRVAKENPSGRTSAREVILEADVSDRTPYAGEPLTYTFRLFNAVQLANARLERPDFEGFTVSEVEDRKNYRRTISGVPYEVTELYYVLVPVTAGERRIVPSVLSCDVLRQSSSGRRGIINDPFFGFGRTRLESRVFRTPSLSVDVRPLPPDPEGKPFSGLIGEFTLDVSLTPQRLEAGESATLSIAVTGQGNFLDMTEPRVMIPDGFKSYKDAPEEDIHVTPNGYRGKKVFRVALVPMAPGEHSLAPVRLRIFDPVRGVYETLSSGPLALNVAPGDPEGTFESVAALPETTGTRKRNVEFTGRDILPLKENLKALESTVPMTPTIFIAWLAAPIVFFMLALLILRRRCAPLSSEKMMMDRAEDALKNAVKSIADDDLFFSFVYRAVISAVLAKAEVPGESLTSPEARRILSEKGYSEDLGTQATRVIEQVESVKFGGEKMERSARQTLLSDTRRILKALK